jgi:hypothetical protein
LFLQASCNLVVFLFGVLCFPPIGMAIVLFNAKAGLAILNTKSSMVWGMGLPETLVDQSSLTSKQLEALQSYLRVANGEMKYREAASGLAKPVTVGSYFRTVQQARDNVRKSIVTLLIGVWVGVVKPEDVRRLLDLAGTGVRELPEEESARFVGVLRALIERVVV